MTPQPQSTVIVYALIGAGITFGLTTLTNYQLAHQWANALVTGGIAGLATLASVGAREGWIAMVRALRGTRPAGGSR